MRDRSKDFWVEFRPAFGELEPFPLGGAKNRSTCHGALDKLCHHPHSAQQCRAFSGPLYVPVFLPFAAALLLAPPADSIRPQATTSAVALPAAAPPLSVQSSGLPITPPPEHAGPVFDGRRGGLLVPLPRREGAIVVDGQLSEAEWSSAALLTGFSQFFPNDGVAAKDSTEVLVWYSATELHVGIRAFAAPGTVRATLADRDKITQDDNVQLFLGTYADSRQALVFGVNPLGIQSDGVLTETGTASSSGFGGGTPKAREATDLAPDYIWKSKGGLRDWGFEVEITIPFKSLRYRKGDEQQWQLHVIRTVQSTGNEESWAPALRASASFLAQSGKLTGLRDLRRGLTLDLIPTVTSSAAGTLNPTSVKWGYNTTRPEIGGSVRWGVTSNLTVAGTANPDFSQVEADATQFSLDPRVAVFFPERRPFFLESQEQFTTPNRLIYTRRIAQPVAAIKLTGKQEGFDVGVLSAVDSKDASFDGRHSPLYNVVRVQRDVGGTSRIGLAYTDKVDGDRWNRVIGADGRYVRGIMSLQAQVATSFSNKGDSTIKAPLWDLSATVNGRHFYGRYSFTGISPNFDAQSGFIARPGIGTISATHQWRMFGKPGALVEAFVPEVYMLGRYQYTALVQGRSSQDRHLHFRSNTRLRGGWQVGGQLLLEEFGYDPSIYANYVTLRPRTGGIDTLKYTGTQILPNRDWVMSMSTPEFRRFSFNSFYLFGKDENFPEWSTADVTISQGTLNVRPTDQLRLSGTWNLESYDRASDASRVLTRQTRRLRTEYQVTRQVFVRVIGELTLLRQDALRDDSRTNAPIYFRGGNGTLSRANAFERRTARLDFLFSYLPSPGNIVYLGYGDALGANQPQGPIKLQRTRDVFFAKLSYLFRVQ